MSKTLDEIFNHHFFINSVNDQISKAKESRQKIIVEAKIRQPHSGIRLKSDAFSSLDEKGMLNPISLASSFINIYEKSSDLPCRERNWISMFVSDIIFQAIVYFDKLEKSEVAVVEPTEKKINKPRKTKKA